MCVKYLWNKFKIIYHFWKFGSGISLSLYHCVWRDTMSNMWNKSYNLKIIYLPLVAIICYFTLKQAGDQVLACFWWMRVWCDWVQPIRFIWLNLSVHPSICSPACLFSSPSIHQPAHWFIVNPCPLLAFLSVLLAFWLYVRLSIFLSFSQLCICWTGCWYVYMSIHP